MKNILLGSSALVAAGILAAAPASAAEPIKLGLGGFYANSVGWNITEDDGTGESGDGRNDFDMHQNIEVHIKGETTLDNGITVGAELQLEGDDDTERWDETWIYFSGGFGEIRAGSEDEAALLTCVADPSTVTRNFGIFSPNEAYNNAGVNGLAGVNSFGSCYGVGGDGLKILYFTPQFGPFNFVVSYAPEANNDDKGPTAGTSLEDDGDDQEDAISVGTNFTHEGSGWSLLASLGGTWVTDDVGDDEETAFYQAGLQVGFGAFAVGVGGEIIRNYNDAFGVGAANTGGFGNATQNAVADESDLWVVQVGGSYTFDAWTLGLGWMHSQMEISSDSDKDTLDYISLNGAYALGPGIALEGNVGYVSYGEDINDANADYDSFEIGFGTSIDF